MPITTTNGNTRTGALPDYGVQFETDGNSFYRPRHQNRSSPMQTVHRTNIRVLQRFKCVYCIRAPVRLQQLLRKTFVNKMS